MFQMLTGTSLFSCDNNDNLVNEQEQRKVATWKGIPDKKLELVLKDCTDQKLTESAKDLLQRCLSTKDKRYKSFNQVFKSSFLNREVIQLQNVATKTNQLEIKK